MMAYHTKVHTEHKKGSSTALPSSNHSVMWILQEGCVCLPPAKQSALNKCLAEYHQGRARHKTEASFVIQML